MPVFIYEFVYEYIFLGQLSFLLAYTCMNNLPLMYVDG